MTPAELAAGLIELSDVLGGGIHPSPLRERWQLMLGEAAAVLAEVADDSRATVSDAASLADALDELAQAQLDWVVESAPPESLPVGPMTRAQRRRCEAVASVVGLWSSRSIAPAEVEPC